GVAGRIAKPGRQLPVAGLWHLKVGEGLDALAILARTLTRERRRGRGTQRVLDTRDRREVLRRVRPADAECGRGPPTFASDDRERLWRRGRGVVDQNLARELTDVVGSIDRLHAERVPAVGNVSVGSHSRCALAFTPPSTDTRTSLMPVLSVALNVTWRVLAIQSAVHRSPPMSAIFGVCASA